MNFDHSSSRETFDHSSSRETRVRRESRIEDIDVSATKGYLSNQASSSGGEASLRSRRVMRELRPNKESRKAMKEASDLGEAKISASMILWIAEMT